MQAVNAVVHLWNRFSDSTKHVRAAIVAGCGGLLLIAGIIVEVPQAVRIVLSHAPTWMSNPTVLWVVVIGSVTAFAVRRILKSQPVEDSGFAVLLREVSDVSHRAGALSCVFQEVLALQTLVSSVAPDKINSQYVYDQLEVSLAQKVEFALGVDAKDRFLNLIRDAKRRAKYTHTVAETALSHLSLILLTELSKEVEAARAMKLIA